jgi:hypothetical protein
MEKGSLQSGLPIPGEASARQHYLRKGVNGPHFSTIKDSFRFYIATSRDKVDENEIPSAELVNTFTKWFSVGFTVSRAHRQTKQPGAEVYNVYRTASRDLSIHIL